MKNILMDQHNGAVAFEYIIILIIMVVAIFAGFKSLSETYQTKTNDVSNFIKSNGQDQLIAESSNGDGEYNVN